MNVGFHCVRSSGHRSIAIFAFPAHAGEGEKSGDSRRYESSSMDYLCRIVHRTYSVALLKST